MEVISKFTRFQKKFLKVHEVVNLHLCRILNQTRSKKEMKEHVLFFLQKYLTQNPSLLQPDDGELQGRLCSEVGEAWVSTAHSHARIANHKPTAATTNHVLLYKTTSVSGNF